MNQKFILPRPRAARRWRSRRASARASSGPERAGSATPERLEQGTSGRWRVRLRARCRRGGAPSDRGERGVGENRDRKMAQDEFQFRCGAEGDALALGADCKAYLTGVLAKRRKCDRKFPRAGA
jgi:hypothetical protein